MPARRVEELAAGASAGLFATALLHPLDLIKTRMQVQDARSQGRRLPMYRGLFHGVRSIVSLEGWAGLFQGLGPNLIGSTTSWGLYMYLYALCKDWLAPRMPPRARTPSWQTSRASTAHTPPRIQCIQAGLLLTRGKPLLAQSAAARRDPAAHGPRGAALRAARQVHTLSVSVAVTPSPTPTPTTSPTPSPNHGSLRGSHFTRWKLLCMLRARAGDVDKAAALH